MIHDPLLCRIVIHLLSRKIVCLEEVHGIVRYIHFESRIYVVAEYVSSILVLLGILQSNEDISLCRNVHACSKEPLVKRLIQFFIDTQHLTRRLHFRSQGYIHIRQLSTGKYRNLDRIFFASLVETCTVVAF